MVEPNFPALVAAMNHRLSELDLYLKELAALAGISEQALYDLRRGRAIPRRKTQHGIEDALGWQRGSVRRVLGGDQPTLAAPERHTETAPLAETGPPSDDPRERAIEAVLETLTPEERLAVLERLIEQHQSPPPQPPNQSHENHGEPNVRDAG